MLGRKSDAIKELNEAERLVDEENSNTEQFLGQAYTVLNETGLAVQHLEKFVTKLKRRGQNPEHTKSIEKSLLDLKSKLSLEYVKSAKPKIYSKTELKETLRRLLTPDEIALTVDPLAGNEEMNRWAKKLVSGATNDLQKARFLFDGLVHRLSPGRDYSGTRSAVEVWKDWENPNVIFMCAEYACLYVALSRAAGLETFFVLVKEDCYGRKVSHACAGVWFGEMALLVDPAYSWLGVPHREIEALDDCQTTVIALSGISRRGDASPSDELQHARICQ